MWWRIKRSQFEKQKGEGNKKAFYQIVKSDKAPGIIAYVDSDPVGWCAVAPRDYFPVLDRSRILKQIDEKPIWSVVCFFVAKPYRKKGVSRELLQAAIKFVRSHGGKIIEGYPIEPKKDRMPEVFAWTGFASVFKSLGFKEVKRRSETRPIMRYYLE